METIIKVLPSELNQKLLDKIRNFIGNKDNIDVTISLKEVDAEYREALNDSIEYAESNEGMITFTMEDFMAYKPMPNPEK